MNKYTDLEQSKELYKIFPNASTGRWWEEWPDGKCEICQDINLAFKDSKLYPQHSLHSILELLPEEITKDRYDSNIVDNYVLRMGKRSAWYEWDANSYIYLDKITFSANDLLTALVDLSKWLHINQYI